MAIPIVSPIKPSFLTPQLIGMRDEWVLENGGYVNDFSITDGDEFINSRSGNALYIDPLGNGVISPAGKNRLDFDSSTGASRGLLIEGRSRTNKWRSSNMEGALVGVVGSGGSLPTGWSITSAAGLTTEVIAVGALGAMGYIDVRVSGTSSGTTYAIGSNSVAAGGAGSKWTEGVFLKKIAGSSSNIINMALYLFETSSPFPFTQVTLNKDTSALTRVFAYRATTVGSGNVQARVGLDMTSGAAIDYTFRIAGVDLFNDWFNFQHVPSTAAADGTASWDNYNGIPISALRINPKEGMLFLEYEMMNYTTGSDVTYVFQMQNAAATSVIKIRASNWTNSAVFRLTGGGQSIDSNGITIVKDQKTKVCIGWKDGANYAYLNGSSIGNASFASFVLNGSFDTFYLGRGAGTSNGFCGRFNKLITLPFQPPASFAQALTA